MTEPERFGGISLSFPISARRSSFLSSSNTNLRKNPNLTSLCSLIFLGCIIELLFLVFARSYSLSATQSSSSSLSFVESVLNRRKISFELFLLSDSVKVRFKQKRTNFIRVDQLIDPITGRWDINRVRQVIASEDVELVLKTKIRSTDNDSRIWGFTKDGNYSSRSGYHLLETLQEYHLSSPDPTPLLEKLLWNSLWKLKTTPKLKHFLWRILSGALAVKERLRSRCIPVDDTCIVCGAGQETICHLLFNCRFAQEVWHRSRIPLPPAGFSMTSTFLNIHYLVSVAGKSDAPQSNCRAFPWILWHIWKARNSLYFEQHRLEASAVLSKANDDFVIWTDLQHQSDLHPSVYPQQPVLMKKWAKPPFGFMKCNIGASWIDETQNSGVSWIARNHLGTTVFHSRRSYSNIVSSLHNDLLSFFWAAESLRNMRIPKVIFQASSPEVRMAFLQPSMFPHLCPVILQILQLLRGFEEWSLEHIEVTGNQPAIAIANNVTREHRYPSYISRNCPAWLQSILLSESTMM